MSPRRRSARRRTLPPNLYERNGYFSWRNPIDGREHGLGRDKRSAIQQAVEANIHVAGLRESTRLVDKLSGTGTRTLAAWLDVYEGKLREREYRPNTLKSYLSLVRLMRESFDTSMLLERIETSHCADAIRALKASGHQRTAQAFRSRLKDLFRSAIADGWIRDNPVLVTDSVKVKVQRARLDFDTFMAVYEATPIQWLRNAMALSLVSAQRREDVVVAAFRAIREDHWECRQLKTGNRVRIPLSLRLDRFGMSLGDVIRQCRDTRILSPHMVHQTRPRGNSPVGSAIWKDTYSKTFARELAALRIDWGEKTAPTVHEIRSLAERLYDAQGNVNTQELLGHRDPRSTQLYHDARGDWVTVRVADSG